MSRRTLVACLTLASLITLPASPAPATASAAVAGAGERTGPEDDPLTAAGYAAQNQSFVGVLQVKWFDGRRDQVESLLVQGGNGSVVVRGDNSVMASPQQRLVEHAGGQWSLLWPGGQMGAGRPSAAGKYQLTSQPGPAVSGRSSRAIEVRHANVLLERLYLDLETDLLLRREQFEDGRASRTIAFESITIGGSSPAPPAPSDVVNAVPTAVRAGSGKAKGVSAPDALADGYQRVGVYRKSGVVQARYSDGFYDLSVFEQRGRLDRDGLPSGGRVTVGEARGWHYPWPGGHVVVWEGGGTVYTAVSDAPLSQIVTAVRSLPPVETSLSLLRRLRQVCRGLIQPLAA